MLHLFRKATIFTLICSFGSLVFSMTNNFLENQNRWVTKDYNRCMEFIDGNNKLEIYHFEQIMNSKSWQIVIQRIDQKIKCTHTNTKKFKEFLTQKSFSENSISLLSQPLLNDNLLFICSRMRELGYSSDDINNFKLFLLALFAPDIFQNILEFQEAINNGFYQTVSWYLGSGFRPNWIIGDNLETGLMIAIENENQNIINLLLSCPFINLEATNRQGKNALMLAIQKGNFTLARTLLEYQGWNLFQKDYYGNSVYDLTRIYLPNLYQELEEYRHEFPQYQQA